MNIIIKLPENSAAQIVESYTNDQGYHDGVETSREDYFVQRVLNHIMANIKSYEANKAAELAQQTKRVEQENILKDVQIFKDVAGQEVEVSKTLALKEVVKEVVEKVIKDK
jgi:hypothetical protein